MKLRKWVLTKFFYFTWYFFQRKIFLICYIKLPATEVFIWITVAIEQWFKEEVLRTSWRCLSSLSSGDALKTSSRRLDQDEYIGLSQTPSSRRFHDNLIRINVFFEVVGLYDVFRRFSKNFFKTSCRRFAKMFTKLHGNVFKTYHQVKLLLVTPLQGVFEMYSTRFSDVLEIGLSTERFASVTLLRNLANGLNFWARTCC